MVERYENSRPVIMKAKAESMRITPDRCMYTMRKPWKAILDFARRMEISSITAALLPIMAPPLSVEFSKPGTRIAHSELKVS